MIKNKNKRLKIKLFTHTDLDGVSCDIVLRKYLQEHFSNKYIDYSVSYVNHDVITKEIQEYLHKNNDLDVLFITDIVPNEETIKLIEEKRKNGLEVFVFDHHVSAQYLTELYSWAVVETHCVDGKQTCATTLLWESANISNVNLRDYVEYVRSYDTWEWKTTNNTHAKQLNDLLYLYGIEKFVSSTLSKHDMCKFTTFEIYDLKKEQIQIENYIKKKIEEVQFTEFLGYNVAFVFYERYGSELGNAVLDEFPTIDFVIKINMGEKLISYTTKREDLNMSKDIAQRFGGGGHPKASGSEFLFKDSESIFNSLLKVAFGL